MAIFHQLAPLAALRETPAPPPASLERIKGEFNYLQSNAITYSSWNTYNQGQLSYTSFYREFNINPYPLNEYILRLFATYLAQHLSYATICTYLSLKRLQHLELGFRSTPEMPLLRLLLRGMNREMGARPKPKRQPITLPLLKALKKVSRTSHFTLYSQKMLRAAFTTAFFGFLHASEFCSPSQSAFDCTTTLLVCDITVLPNVAILRIKTSKGDQFRKGSEVRLAMSGNSVCPFCSLEQHLIQC